MKRILILILFLAAFILTADPLLVDIEIEGLKRTQEETVLQIIKFQPGDAWQEDSLERVEQRLRQSGIFQNEMELSFSEEAEGIALKLVLQDKWTLLAIPFFSVSQGVPMGGLFALDSNFLGRQHLFLVSGSYSSLEQSGFALYQIPRISDTPFSYLQSFLYSNRLKTISDLEGDTILGEFRDQWIGSSIRGGYAFNDSFNLYLQFGGFYRVLDQDSSSLTIEDSQGFIGQLSIRSDWENLYLFPLFSEGFSVSLEGAWNYSDSDPFWSAEGSASYSFVPWSWLQLQIYGDGFYTQGSLEDYRYLGKRRGSRSLPDEQVPGQQVFSSELSAEFRLWSFSFGSITLPVFYEAGWFDGIQGEDSYSGAGGGIRFYIDKVAVPAMGLEYHYSFSGAEPNITFAIGASF